MKLKIRNNNLITGKSKKMISRIFLVLLVIILLSVSIFVWYKTRQTDFLQISQNTTSKADYYTKEIELKNIKIESVLQEFASNKIPDLDKPDTEWREDATFYIQHYEGIESIIWADKELLIRKILSTSNTDFVINQSVKSVSPDLEHLYLIEPAYIDMELNGFIFSEINILKLVLSVTRESKEDYETQIYNEGTLIYSSEDWKLSKDNFTKRMQFDLKNSNSYYLVLKPSVELLKLNTRNANLTLLLGCFLSLGIFVISLIAQSLNSKSKLLLKAYEKLKSYKVELEEKNDSLQKQLKSQQKLESIGLLASGIAHEINNPINGVLNYSQLIMESSDINSENIEYTKEIILETERISKLVSNLLLFSRKGKDSFSSARIEDIIERATILMETIFKKDQINLNVNIPEHLPSIKCRSQQIQQVLMNLLTNARDSLNDKFTDYNEDKIILVTAEEIEDDNKRWVRTIVEDHGKGISAAVQPKIFGQFFTTKDIGKGTGLGLAISLEIVKEHDGKLTFETEEGKYTKFYLDIPVKE